MSDETRQMCETDWEKLYAAIENGDLDSVRGMVERFEELRNEEEMSENLRSAVSENQLDIVKYFTQSGADVNFQDPEIKYYGALDAACGKGFLDIAQYLFSQGAKIIINTDSNPMMSAIHSRHAHIVRWLITTGMDINASEMTGGGGLTNPLLYASNWGQEDEIVMMLKAAGANLPEDAVEPTPQELPLPSIESSNTLEELHEKIEGEIFEVLKGEIQTHLDKLKAAGVDFYGYSVQTPNWSDVDQPIVIYNCEHDTADGDQGNAYFRYSVDEWQNYETDALLATTSCLSVVSNDIERLEVDSDAKDNVHTSIYKMFARVLSEIRVERLVAESVVLLIWCDDEELMTQFARELNRKNVADAFETEFGI